MNEELSVLRIITSIKSLCAKVTFLSSIINMQACSFENIIAIALLTFHICFTAVEKISVDAHHSTCIGNNRIYCTTCILK